MIGWLLRFILLLIVIRLVWRFVAGMIEGARPPARVSRGGQGSAVPLVRDPVCGTYVVRDRALTSGSGANQHFFCSDRCRDEWQHGQAGRRAE